MFYFIVKKKFICLFCKVNSFYIYTSTRFLPLFIVYFRKNKSNVKSQSTIYSLEMDEEK